MLPGEVGPAQLPQPWLHAVRRRVHVPLPHQRQNTLCAAGGELRTRRQLEPGGKKRDGTAVKQEDAQITNIPPGARRRRDITLPAWGPQAWTWGGGISLLRPTTPPTPILVGVRPPSLPLGLPETAWVRRFLGYFFGAKIAPLSLTFEGFGDFCTALHFSHEPRPESLPRSDPVLLLFPKICLKISAFKKTLSASHERVQRGHNHTKQCWCPIPWSSPPPVHHSHTREL